MTFSISIRCEDGSEILHQCENEDHMKQVIQSLRASFSLLTWDDFVRIAGVLGVSSSKLSPDKALSGMQPLPDNQNDF